MLTGRCATTVMHREVSRLRGELAHGTKEEQRVRTNTKYRDTYVSTA